MPTANQPPLPGENCEPETVHLIDPATGKPVLIADLRAEFERLSRQIPRDRKAELAFIESKVEIIRADSSLTEAEKESAIAELRLGSQST